MQWYECRVHGWHGAGACHGMMHDGMVQVGYPHDIKGEGIYAYVTLKDGFNYDEDTARRLRSVVREQIGGFAAPDFVQLTPGLPKTRSGKIMRRILRKVAADRTEELGDTSTLADPSVVQDIIKNRKNRPYSEIESIG